MLPPGQSAQQRSGVGQSVSALSQASLGGEPSLLQLLIESVVCRGSCKRKRVCVGRAQSTRPALQAGSVLGRRRLLRLWDQGFGSGGAGEAGLQRNVGSSPGVRGGARSLCTQEGPELLKVSESLPCAQAEGGSACSSLTTPTQWGREQCGLMR